MPENNPNTSEIWKPIPSCLEMYEASTLGHIRSVARVTRNHHAKILKPRKMQSRYLRVNLSIKGLHLTRNVHSLVSEAFLGIRNPSMQTNHKNGKKYDNRIENLEYVTASENAIHARRVLGLCNEDGEKNPAARLNEKQVIEIRHLYKPRKMTYAKIAKIFMVNLNTIGHIVRRETWKHIS